VSPTSAALAILLAAGTTACFASARLELFVATGGDDKGPGTRDKPFASLRGARDAIRRLKKSGRLPTGELIVTVRGGLHQLTETFELTKEDSGTKQCPVTYRASPQEQVRIVGGQKVSGFRPVTDPAILNRLDPAAREKVVCVDLGANGIEDFGELRIRGFGQPSRPAHLELFFNGRPMTLARWPNVGFVKIVSLPSGNIAIDGSGVSRGKKTKSFGYSGARPKRWKWPADIYLHGYWTYDWADIYTGIKSIDTRTGQVFPEPIPRGYGFRIGQRFYWLNILEELDRPGEWYLDRATGMLYFWPPEPVADGEALVSLLEAPLVTMTGTSHVRLVGMTFECARGDAIVIIAGADNMIGGCTIRNVGNAGVVISGGGANGVVGCDIYQTGEGGILLKGGNRKTLNPSGHYARNNHIHHFARWSRTYRPAVRIQGVGNVAAHNLIHDAPHTAILLSGNDHLVEFNEIHRVCLETGDVGAFYMGRDWTARGNIVRYNYFHHLGGVGLGSMAVYLDDCASGTTVFGNVFYKAGRAVLIGGGRDNLVENNIFVQCNPAVHVDDRGVGWASRRIEGRQGSWDLYGKLEAVGGAKPPYATRYPKLAKILRDEPQAPKGNVVVRNVFHGGRWVDLRGVARELVVLRDNLIKVDPGFVNADKLDFRLRDDSPAFKKGFKRIPMQRIGLYKDEYRSAAHKTAGIARP